MDSRPFNEVAFGDLAQCVSTRTWLWDGIIGPGQFTLLTAHPKAGKTTLLSALLAKRNDSGRITEGSRIRQNSGAENPNSGEFGYEPAPALVTPSPPHLATPSCTLAGRSVVPGPSVVASEEPTDLWLARGRALGFRNDTVFFCRPFVGKPNLTQLDSLCKRIIELRETRGADLAVFDSLVHFLPRGAENNADLLIEAMTPIRRLTEAGFAVVALHHPSKGTNSAGPNARGTIALTAFADVALELREVSPHDKRDRRRHLLAWSRFPETPTALLIELTEDATDYRVLELPDDAESEFWPGLRQVLEDARSRLDRAAILAAWPSEHAAPSDRTLFRLLEDAVSRGLVCRDGEGHRYDPHRYWLPQKSAELAADLGCRLDDLHRAQLLSLPPEVRRAAELESATVEWDEEDDGMRG